MSCICCKKVYDLGCLDTCNPIKLPIFAENDGMYIFSFDYLGTKINYKAFHYAGEQFAVRNFAINSDYFYTFVLYDEYGNTVEMEDDSDPLIPYDCFSFKQEVTNYYTQNDTEDYSYGC